MDFQTYRERFKRILDSIDPKEVSGLLELLVRAREEGRWVFIVGNGGSAANASHACEDLIKGTLSDFENQKRLKIMSLTDNTPALLAWANDEGYDRVFVEQLKTFASPGDLLIAISGSGNSPNVLAAVDWAEKNGLTTVGLTGFDGGKLKRAARAGVHVPIEDMGAAEAAHDVIFHYLVAALYERFAAESKVKNDA